MVKMKFHVINHHVTTYYHILQDYCKNQDVLFLQCDFAKLRIEKF